MKIRKKLAIAVMSVAMVGGMSVATDANAGALTDAAKQRRHEATRIAQINDRVEGEGTREQSSKLKKRGWKKPKFCNKGRFVGHRAKAIYAYCFWLEHQLPGRRVTLPWNNQIWTGGGAFLNMEGLLPKGKKWLEFDMTPHMSGQNRGQNRIIVDTAKKVLYYTLDHYRTFTKVDLEREL